MDKTQRRNNKKERVKQGKGRGNMASSIGVILSVEGETAKAILAELEKPNINENLLKECAELAKIFKAGEKEDK